MSSYPDFQEQQRFPDFREQGYEVIREIGRNREGGRITWLATNINTKQPEVIKQFCFAQAGAKLMCS